MSGAPAYLSQLARSRPRVAHGLAGGHASVYRSTRGRMLARWFGASILVLETVGRRSGRRRAVPLVYVRDGDDLIVVPANAGADRAPGWWLNLRARRAGVAVLGPERRRVRPLEATGADRERLWALVAAVSPLEDYQRQTARRIPVVRLAPVTAGSPPRSPGGSPHTRRAGWPHTIDLTPPGQP